MLKSDSSYSKFKFANVNNNKKMGRKHGLFIAFSRFYTKYDNIIHDNILVNV